MPMETLRTQVMAANRHERGLKMQPSLAVEADWFAAIQKDVTKLLQERETSDVMQKDHPTNWPFGRAATPHNLFNKSGVTSQYSTGHSGATEGCTFAAPQLESLRQFFVLFESRLITFRLKGLMPASGWGAHEEAIIKGDQLRIRFHLPIFTNPGASVFLDEEKFHFHEGYIYLFNNGCVHPAVNEGETNRYHFVWDMWLDEWVYEKLLNLDSPVTPCPRLRKLTSGEVAELSRGEECPIDQYIIGTPSGELILARKRKAQDGSVAVWKTRLHEGPDIVSENAPLGLGDGWYALEKYSGETFRWVNNDAVITVAAADAGSGLLSLELEPGPSMNGRPLVLKVLDNDGCEIRTTELHSRRRLEITLPVHAGPLNTFRLHAEGGGAAVPGDPRILNFRIFQIGSES